FKKPVIQKGQTRLNGMGHGGAVLMMKQGRDARMNEVGLLAFREGTARTQAGTRATRYSPAFFGTDAASHRKRLAERSGKVSGDCGKSPTGRSALANPQ